VDQFQALTDYASVVNRLAAFEERCETAAGGDRSDERARIEVDEDKARVVLDNITLTTPDSARVLQSKLSLEVAEGDSLLLTGPTGAGKTSLMRAIAGLWRFGSGRILRPPRGEILFMPQKPYPYFLHPSLREDQEHPRCATRMIRRS
jgi:vitamin B12/bleomycin/antimicrobial peptide transport system ATP-binding/permease protein